ncbi:MAG: hypothetical protein KY475_25775, partial [Planctomycetes bacterium]|nr:hypothetical protein [Planctomycetota bacterium]
MKGVVRDAHRANYAGQFPHVPPSTQNRSYAMFTHATRLVALTALCAALAAGAFAPAASAQDATGAAEKSLPSLLSESTFMHRQLENGLYRIAVERDAGMMSVMAEEVTMSWKHDDGSDVK